MTAPCILAIDPGTHKSGLWTDALDVSLCDGNGEPACEDCARRLADSKGIRWWIEPVADGEGCEMKIEVDHD